MCLPINCFPIGIRIASSPLPPVALPPRGQCFGKDSCTHPPSVQWVVLIFLHFFFWLCLFLALPSPRHQLSTHSYTGAAAATRAENLVSCVVLGRLALTCFPSTLHACVCLLTWLVIPFLLILAEVQSAAQLRAEEEAPLTTHPTWSCYFILTRTSPHHAIILPRWEWKPLALQIQVACVMFGSGCLGPGLGLFNGRHSHLSPNLNQ